MLRGQCPRAERERRPLRDSGGRGGRTLACAQLSPKSPALQRDLEDYLRYYNFERAHTGRHNAGATPAQLVYGARKMRPR